MRAVPAFEIRLVRRRHGRARYHELQRGALPRQRRHDAADPDIPILVVVAAFDAILPDPVRGSADDDRRLARYGGGVRLDEIPKLGGSAPRRLTRNRDPGVAGRCRPGTARARGEGERPRSAERREVPMLR